MNTENTIPFVNLAKQTASIKGDLLKAVEGVLDSGNYILGKEVAAFEKDFAKICGTEFSLGIANATCALHLVLRGLGLKEGDEVITCANSFIASTATIAMAGATPVFVDIREDLNIDPSKIEAAITPKTKAIMPVHLTGRMAPMVEIMAIAKKHNLFVLEDAAQAILAKLNGKPAGSWGDAASFSLHPLKNLHGFGDGGMMTTNSKQVYEHMILARNHGLKGRNECEFWSLNCRLDELQAAMLRVQLKKLEQYTDEKRRLAHRYHSLLKPYVKVPEEAQGEYSVYQTYIVIAECRDELMEYLKTNGIESKIHYPIPLHHLKAAKSLNYTDEDLPVTAQLSKKILSLPLFIGMTDSQQDRVVEVISKFYSTK